MSTLRFLSRRTLPAFRSFQLSKHVGGSFSSSVLFRAGYSSGAGLSRSDIEKRVLEVLKGFEKVDPNKLTPTASFSKDLGLDSLDAVEVVMAVEEEFAIEIPDAEADEIQTVAQAIDYLAKTPEAH